MNNEILSRNNLFMNNCKIMKFKDCILNLNTGLNPRNNFSLGSGSIKYITAKNLNKSGSIDFSKCDLIDEKAKEIIHKRSDIQMGDILFSSRAPVGHCHLIQDIPNYYDIGESIFSIRVNKKVILPEYMCLYLTSDYFIKSASKHTTGSVIQEIRIANLMNMDIIIPTDNIQRKISKIIMTINKKIENNNQINNNLENLIKTIYQRWFIEYEFPNEDGKPYKSSGGKMVWNDYFKVEIPAIWKVRSLKETTSMYQPETFDAKKIIENGKYNVYGAGGFMGFYNEYNHEESETFISCRGSCGNVYYSLPKSLITGNAMIVHPNDLEYKQYLYLTLKKIGVKNCITGSVQPQITRDNLNDWKYIYPNYDDIKNFNIVVDKMFEMMKNSIIESRKLKELRDYLLPMLMNGQINVDDIKI